MASLASMFLLTACGQTGPLYMPKPPNRQPAASSAPATTAPAVTPPAPAAGVTLPAGGSNANMPEATTNQPPPAPH